LTKQAAQLYEDGRGFFPFYTFRNKNKRTVCCVFAIKHKKGKPGKKKGRGEN